MTHNQIMEAVQRHHNAVAERYGETFRKDITHTVLIGSQNYGIDHEGSDIDTFTFVLPSLKSIAFLDKPISEEFCVDDGKCSVKDLRLALNLLTKPTPNSLEWFISKYQVYEPPYESTLKSMQSMEKDDVIHSDYKNMVNAVAGKVFQLTTRNMPAGKCYGHALRLRDMWYQYVNASEPTRLLGFMDDATRQKALEAKLDTDARHDAYYEEEVLKINNELTELQKEFVLTEDMKKQQHRSFQAIRKYQEILMWLRLKQ